MAILWMALLQLNPLYHSNRVMHTVNMYPCSFVAAASIDFLAVIIEDLTFEPGSLIQCVDVVIADDTIDEDNEDFTLSLMTTQDNVIIDPATTRVVILDEDGM